MISAAAFRRPPPRSPIIPGTEDNGGEESDLLAPPPLPDVTSPRSSTPTIPLHVRKRGGAPPHGVRSISASSVSERNAPSHVLRVMNEDPPQDSHQDSQHPGIIPDEEEFMRELEKDVEPPRPNGRSSAPRSTSGRGAGYESGRFSTNLE